MADDPVSIERHDDRIVHSESRVRGRPSKIRVIVGNASLVCDCLAQCFGDTMASGVLRVENVDAWVRVKDTHPPVDLLILCAVGQEPAQLEVSIARLSEIESCPPFVVVSDIDSPDIICQAVERGARGFIPTSTTLEIALSALRVVEVGGTFVPAASVFRGRICSVVPQDDIVRPAAFTDRQAAIADAIRKGKSNKQIAYDLNMRESTVKVHIRKIMKKLNARNRTEVAIMTG